MGRLVEIRFEKTGRNRLEDQDLDNLSGRQLRAVVNRAFEDPSGMRLVIEPADSAIAVLDRMGQAFNVRSLGRLFHAPRFPLGGLLRR